MSSYDNEQILKEKLEHAIEALEVIARSVDQDRYDLRKYAKQTLEELKR